MVKLQSEPIDYQALTEAVRSTSSGAVCLFLGTVREFTGSQQTVALTYEAHPKLAVQLLAQVESEVHSRWPVKQVAIVHRTGRLELGEISVAIAIGCPHRAEAFAACQYAMERIKEIVPIWKEELAPDGQREWVHPK
ncbi:MAG: molybdenum cofactor biosynthesis protein MoaE [Gemmatales bacterium]